MNPRLVAKFQCPRGVYDLGRPPPAGTALGNLHAPHSL